MPLRPPPLDFHPITECTWAQISDQPPEFVRDQPRRRGRRLLGIKYEAKAQDALGERYGRRYYRSPWLRYKTQHDPRVRWCQPDGVLFTPETNRITIIEFKYNHTELAWWQMFRLYKPVLERVFEAERYDIACCEVVKWFDPAAKMPMPTKLRARIDDAAPGEFAVHIFAP